jgi:hypothetical protein
MADEPTQQSDIDQELVSWVLGTIEPWEDYRDNNFEKDWEEYYQQWKGIWVQNGKTRSSERSRFISPALAQAIEMAVSEMEEATFNRKYWFDVDDNISDQDKTDRRPIRNQLIEDMEVRAVPKAISEVYLNGAIYGTGIAKIVTSEVTDKFTAPDGSDLDYSKVEVDLIPISPKEFCIDPSSKNVNEGLGCAHTPIVPKIDVLKKQDDDIYNDVPLGSYTDDENNASMGEQGNVISGDRTELIEYHGLVPAGLLTDITNKDGSVDPVAADLALNFDEVDMVEAIVTIANRSALLKAVENPFIYRDRSIVAYQHDTVPNRFWGRGVAEKGIQSQRALNAELRARQDGLALTIHPMIAADATRLPRGSKLTVSPGKQILTNGDPRAALMPFHFGEMSAHTYREAGELERMLQMGTGSMDSATPIGGSPRNATASGMSMIASGSIKRSKRTMRNIEEDFLKPMINKFSWRYQQFDPERYPFGDYKLLPFSTMGIMAREFEQGNIVQAMQGIPDGPAKGVLIKAFVDNLSIPFKQELEQAIEQQFAPQPPDPMMKELQRLQLVEQYIKTENMKKEGGKIVSEIAENYANAASKETQTEVNAFNAVAAIERDEIDRAEDKLDRQAFGKQEDKE